MHRKTSQASKALALAQKAWDHVDHEFHYVRGYVANQDVLELAINTPQGDYISDIAQGDGDDQRSGDACTIQTVSIKGFIRVDPASTVTGQVVRMALVWDKQCTGLIPLYEDVFETSGVVGTADVVFWDRNRANLSRFSVLMDKVFLLTPESHQAQKFDFSRSIKKTARYNGVGDTTAHCDAGLFLIYTGDLAANEPDISYRRTTKFAG